MPLIATLQIRPFQPQQADEVASFIISIQRGEFGVPVTLADQPDLARIPEVYQTRRGGFWVGLDGETVVGSVGLIDFGAGGVALRKMFVHANYRGPAFGLGQALLDHVIRHAHEQRVEAITLGTQERLRAARRFYERNGFEAVDPNALPIGFPRMAVDTHFYTLKISS